MLAETEDVQRLVKERNDWWCWGFACGFFSGSLGITVIVVLARVVVVLWQAE